MSKFQCNDCKRNFVKKSHLVNHLNKKNKCKPLICEIPENYPNNIQNIPETAHFIPGIAQITPQNIQNNTGNSAFFPLNLASNSNALNLQNIPLNPLSNIQIPYYTMDKNNIPKSQNISLNQLSNNQIPSFINYPTNDLNTQNMSLNPLVNNHIPFYIIDNNNVPKSQNIHLNHPSNNQTHPYINNNNTNVNPQNIPFNPTISNQLPIYNVNNNNIPNHQNTENNIINIGTNIPIANLNDDLPIVENKLACNYCHKSFARKNALYRHINNSCKVVKEQNKEKQDIFEKLLLLETKNKLLEEEIKNKNKHLEECIKKINCSNTTNNTINNNTINNTINVINVVSHGEENLIEKKIGELMLLISTKRGFNVVEELISQVHFSPRYPEFQNIYIPDIKNKHAMVFDKVWKLKNLDDIIKDLYDNKSNYITENKDVFFDHLNIKEQIVYQRWVDTINDKTSANYKKYYCNMHDNVKLMMFNNREMVITTKNNRPITI